MKKMSSSNSMFCSMYKPGCLALLLLFVASCSNEPQRPAQEDPDRLIVESGVMKWESTGEEASLFGVNYSPAFAHSFRAIGVMGRSHKEAIEEDSYHFSRLGLDAYRIHMWDTEVTDSLGNLLENVHLDLHDYTLSKMKERDIKVIMTPLTFYNNAYPDGATETPGFANYISKGQAPQNPEFWPVLKNYLGQLINHKNPYTGLTAIEDPNILAIEIVNEPSHGSDHARTTEYINGLVDHMRENGWDKPIFYNISQSPGAAPGVLDSDIQGVTFQWYPAGLVGGELIDRNYLPYVNRYPVPWDDDERFREKAMMVYEFSPADTRNGYALPLMARSFRSAGFQWATQFAYDPLAFAHANSDYQTHFLNMIYTPSKSISMLIASEVFDRVPRRQTFSFFPGDNVFGDFRVSHDRDLSELNAPEAFIHSNTTETRPASEPDLERIAGYGSSPVVSYDGLGAYFLDKLDEGIWRLEVMPDAVPVSDPFERPDFNKYVTHIVHGEHDMHIELDDLGTDFSVDGLNEGNSVSLEVDNGSFLATPGAWLLTRSGIDNDSWTADSWMDRIQIGEYVTAPETVDSPVVSHEPVGSVEAGIPVTIDATVLGIAPEDRVLLQVNPVTAQNIQIEMSPVGPYRFQAVIPAEQVTIGGFDYRIILDREAGSVTFPGGHRGAPWNWNYYHDETWSADVLYPEENLEIYNAADDFSLTEQGFGEFGGANQSSLNRSSDSGNLTRRISSSQPTEHRHTLGLSLMVSDKLNNISRETLASYTTIVVRAKTDYPLPAPLKVVLVDNRGNSYSSSIPVTGNMREHRLPLSGFQPDAFMLLPRSYPPFMESWFASGGSGTLSAVGLEQIQFLIDTRDTAYSGGISYGFDIERAWFEP